jgi:hypothetical protein
VSHGRKIGNKAIKDTLGWKCYRAPFIAVREYMKTLCFVVLVLLSYCSFTGEDKMIHNNPERVSQLRDLLAKENSLLMKVLFILGHLLQKLRLFANK